MGLRLIVIRFIFLIAITALSSSCSSIRIERRHYNDGVFISVNKNQTSNQEKDKTEQSYKEPEQSLSLEQDDNLSALKAEAVFEDKSREQPVFASADDKSLDELTRIALPAVPKIKQSPSHPAIKERKVHKENSDESNNTLGIVLGLLSLILGIASCLFLLYVMVTAAIVTGIAGLVFGIIGIIAVKNDTKTGHILSILGISFAGISLLITAFIWLIIIPMCESANCCYF